MKYKSELYKKEQINLSNKIINILGLNENGQIILYHLDNDKNKTDKIMLLLPDLRKYFMFKNINGIENPNKLKRPWLSIIRHITKITYNMVSKDRHLMIDGNTIRTKIYTFTKR
jgi:hypothetical protein